ncbi:hypothetical protein L218DRAFT_999945 [Marasmius fiardii PR-910]|nr:hypothetical protein L218DRAFT_999945 [Marasmius fiardii PR-910]
MDHPELCQRVPTSRNARLNAIRPYPRRGAALPEPQPQQNVVHEQPILDDIDAQREHEEIKILVGFLILVRKLPLDAVVYHGIITYSSHTACDLYLFHRDCPLDSALLSQNSQKLDCHHLPSTNSGSSSSQYLQYDLVFGGELALQFPSLASLRLVLNWDDLSLLNYHGPALPERSGSLEKRDSRIGRETLGSVEITRSLVNGDRPFRA